LAWFKKSKELKPDKKVKIPEGLWVKCESCREIIYKKEIDKNLKICPKCNYHFRISARERLKLLVDDGSFIEMDAALTSNDPLHFRDKMPYRERIEENRKRSGLQEAAISGEAAIEGHPAIVVFMDFSFMGGSMGSVVGEKVVRAAEAAVDKKIPLIVVASSGGARMQEGIFSLMQMARVSAAIAKLNDSGGLYISILAEPRSLIGFAGPRVIEQTIKQQLPDDFQRSEFLLKHGIIDRIVDRKDMKTTIAKIIELLS
jgi:acetyl-CoA carboxylase carboxyl transferase subunit beta